MAHRAGTIYTIPESVTVNHTPTVSDVAREAVPILYSISSIWPFKFFTDQLIIRLHHLDFVRGVFFFTESNTRLQIQDIKQVVANYNPFFGALEITPQGPLEQIMHIAYLNPRKALRAKRIIAGLMECTAKNVDFSSYPQRELVTAMEEIGRARE